MLKLRTLSAAAGLLLALGLSACDEGGGNGEGVPPATAPQGAPPAQQ